MQISKLQFISNYQSKHSHLDQVKMLVESGIKWVQYRPKNSDRETILKEVVEIAEYCKKHSITFIMNDMVDIALEINADGVHLGKSDMLPSEARHLLGENKIIGGTANTIEDIVELVNQGVDYVGLGPYKFTETKKKLSPVLGLNGYKDIIAELNKMNINIPIIAIGGIKHEDINPIQSTGIHGIAISSLLSESKNESIRAIEIFNINHDNI